MIAHLALQRKLTYQSTLRFLFTPIALVTVVFADLLAPTHDIRISTRKPLADLLAPTGGIRISTRKSLADLLAPTRAPYFFVALDLPELFRKKDLPNKTLIAIHVTPRAGRDEVVGLGLDAQGSREVRVRVCAPPDGGKANKAVCKLIASALGVPKSSVEVTSGQTSRHKRVSLPCEEKQIADWMDTLEVL